MCLLMYLVEQLTRHDLYLRVTHKDRTHNEWADQLAGRDSTGFDPKKRFYPTLTLPTFDRLRRMAIDMGSTEPKVQKTKNYLQSKEDDRTTKRLRKQEPVQQTTGVVRTPGTTNADPPPDHSNRKEPMTQLYQ